MSFVNKPSLLSLKFLLWDLGRYLVLCRLGNVEKLCRFGWWMMDEPSFYFSLQFKDYTFSPLIKTLGHFKPSHGTTSQTVSTLGFYRKTQNFKLKEIIYAPVFAFAQKKNNRIEAGHGQSQCFCANFTHIITTRVATFALFRLQAKLFSPYKSLSIVI